MKVINLRLLTAAFFYAAIIACPLAMAAPSNTVPRDVALREGGVLFGQVVDSQGGALVEAPVVLISGKKEIARTQTDRGGRFSVAGIKGGVYDVATSGHRDIYRLWAPQTAPPAAQQGLMMVTADHFVLGQNCGCGVVGCGGACGSGYSQGPLRNAATWMANHPVITAGAIAAAIAIPLAIDDDDSATN